MTKHDVIQTDNVIVKNKGGIMKNFVKTLAGLAGNENGYLAINTIIAGYYRKKIREIIQKNTDSFSVFHFCSTSLIKEENGISYFRIEKIGNAESAIITSEGNFIIPFNEYDCLFCYDEDTIKYSLNNETYLIGFDGKIKTKHNIEGKTYYYPKNNNNITDKIAEEIISELKNTKETNIYLDILKNIQKNWEDTQQIVEKNTKLLEASSLSYSVLEGIYSETRFFMNEKNKRFFMLRDKETKKCALVSAKGIMLSDFKYDDILGFVNGECDFICAIKNSKIGLLDCLGNVVVKPEYDNVISFSDGLAAVRKNSKTGYINSTGKMVIPQIYDKGENFCFGSAKVTLNGENFYINRRGERIEE